MKKSWFEALAYAAHKHRHQKRKGSEAIPYINHCIQVVQILAEAGYHEEEDLLIAALLHDTLEDTDAQPEELSQRFGPSVLAWVLEVSDDKSLPKHERKQRQIDESGKKSREARLIKLADKISNVSDIIHHPPNWPISRKKEYADWAAQVVNQLRGTSDDLEKKFDALYEEARNTFVENY